MQLGDVHVVESSPLFTARFLLLFVKSDFLLALKENLLHWGHGGYKLLFLHFYDLSAGCEGAQK